MPTIRDDATVSACDEAVDRIERQYETVDGIDMDGFLTFMAEEAQLDSETTNRRVVTTIIERDGETVTDSRIYGDMAPLYDVDPDESPLIC